MIDPVSRILSYAQRNGFWATIKRLRLAWARVFTGNQTVLFFCDLSRLAPTAFEPIADAKVECMRAASDLNAEELSRIINVGNPKIAQQRLSERFERGALLWLIKIKDKLAGFGWTIQGQTMEPHYFPLAGNDVHLFDFFVFPEFRGKHVNPFLVNHILRSLDAGVASRAFIEAAEWNGAQLSSLKRTPFIRLGRAGKCPVFGTTLVLWRQEMNQTPQAFDSK